jgi:Cu-processing system ATP-binding protein
MMSATAQRDTAEPGDRGAFGVRALSKSFGTLQVLDSLSLDFEPGRITALLGPNGSGKTTLLKCLIGLVHPDVGTVLVGNNLVNGSGRHRHDIGFMPQLPHFPAQLTGWELASMLDDLRRFHGKADEDLVDAFEVREEMNKPFRTLSGGTRQKVNAALAFRYGAPIMILDEPTAGLDPVAAMALKEKVRARRNSGCTVLITSHNLGELESLAESVVFLLDGRARFDGTLEELLRDTERRTLEEAIAHLMLQRDSVPEEAPLQSMERKDLSLRLGVA